MSKSEESYSPQQDCLNILQEQAAPQQQLTWNNDSYVSSNTKSSYCINNSQWSPYYFQTKDHKFACGFYNKHTGEYQYHLEDNQGNMQIHSYSSGLWSVTGSYPKQELEKYLIPEQKVDINQNRVNYFTSYTTEYSQKSSTLLLASSKMIQALEYCEHNKNAAQSKFPGISPEHRQYMKNFLQYYVTQNDPNQFHEMLTKLEDMHGKYGEGFDAMIEMMNENGLMRNIPDRDIPSVPLFEQGKQYGSFGTAQKLLGSSNVYFSQEEQAISNEQMVCERIGDIYLGGVLVMYNKTLGTCTQYWCPDQNQLSVTIPLCENLNVGSDIKAKLQDMTPTEAAKYITLNLKMPEQGDKSVLQLGDQLNRIYRQSDDRVSKSGKVDTDCSAMYNLITKAGSELMQDRNRAYMKCTQHLSKDYKTGRVPY